MSSLVQWLPVIVLRNISLFFDLGAKMLPSIRFRKKCSLLHILLFSLAELKP